MDTLRIDGLLNYNITWRAEIIKKYFAVLIAVIFFFSYTQNSIEILDQYTCGSLKEIKCKVDEVLLKPSTALIYRDAEFSFVSDNNVKHVTISFYNNNENARSDF